VHHPRAFRAIVILERSEGSSVYVGGPLGAATVPRPAGKILRGAQG